MKQIATLLICGLILVNPSRAETPCDFKGISVGNKMTPDEIMATLGVTNYKTSPAKRFDKAAAEKYGTIPALELEEEEIGPYCDHSSCRVPHGVFVGNDNTPVNVFISFHDLLITEIDVSFSLSNWDEVVPILDQKYGADWKVERSEALISDYVTKKVMILPSITLQPH
jgi:hypothetical protein